jgi:hypothetical protein
MPKPFTMGSLIAAVILSVAALGVIAGWQAPPSGTGGVFGNFTWLDQDDFGRRQNELQFLKAAFDRLETEAQQDPTGPATRSLRTEQEAVLARMREVARPLPADSIAADLRPVLKGEAHAVPQAAAVSGQPAETPQNAAVPRELQIGLSRPAPGVALGMSRDPELGVMVLIARPRPRPVPREPAAEASTEPQSAGVDGKPTAKPRAAEKRSAAPLLPETGGRMEPNRPATAAAAALR